MEIMELLQQYFWEFIQTATPIVIATIFGFLGTKAYELGEYLKVKFNNAKLDSAVDGINKVLENYLKLSEIELKNKIGEGFADDGKLDEQEVMEIVNDIKERVLVQGSNKSKKLISEMLEDVDTYVENLVRIKVEEIKEKIELEILGNVVAK